jgi:hypothetical protein
MLEGCWVHQRTSEAGTHMTNPSPPSNLLKGSHLPRTHNPLYLFYYLEVGVAGTVLGFELRALCLPLEPCHQPFLL